MEKNKIEKILWSIAKVASESASTVFLYQPKTPDKLLKKNNNKEK